MQVTWGPVTTDSKEEAGATLLAMRASLKDASPATRWHFLVQGNDGN